MNPDDPVIAIRVECNRLHRAIQLLAFDAGYMWQSQRYRVEVCGAALYDADYNPRIHLYRNRVASIAECRFLYRTQVIGTIAPPEVDAATLVLSDLVTWLQVPSES